MSPYARVHVAFALGVGSVLVALAAREMVPPDLRGMAGLALAAVSVVFLERIAGPRQGAAR